MDSSDGPRAPSKNLNLLTEQWVQHRTQLITSCDPFFHGPASLPWKLLHHFIEKRQGPLKIFRTAWKPLPLGNNVNFKAASYIYYKEANPIELRESYLQVSHYTQQQLLRSDMGASFTTGGERINIPNAYRTMQENKNETQPAHIPLDSITLLSPIFMASESTIHGQEKCLPRFLHGN